MALKEPGKFPAKIKDYGIWKGAKGPMAAIMFEYKDGKGNVHDLTWFGSFNGGARDITVETLVRCGFKGDNAADMNRGKGSGVLDETLTLDITVENEQKFNGAPGEMQSRVKWVNLPGSGGFNQRLETGEANVLLGGLNLGGDFAAARQAAGVKKATANPAPEQGAFTEDDIPF